LFLGHGDMNKKYLDINSKFCFFLFSPYKGDENYKSDPKKHEQCLNKFKELGFSILILDDDDKTLFLYHKKQKKEWMWEEGIKNSKEYQVNIIFVDVLGLTLSKQESLNKILSVDCEEIK
jgi:hypothetical protein